MYELQKYPTPLTRQLPGCTVPHSTCTHAYWHATRAQRACRAPPASGSRFGMNSEATQRAVELAALLTRPTVRSLAVVGSSANAEGRNNCRAARRSSTSRREPLPAGCQALAGRPGVLHGRQATLKDEHPSPTPSDQHPVFNTLMCPFSFWSLGPDTGQKVINGRSGHASAGRRS